MGTVSRRWQCHPGTWQPQTHPKATPNPPRAEEGGGGERGPPAPQQLGVTAPRWAPSRTGDVPPHASHPTGQGENPFIPPQDPTPSAPSFPLLFFPVFFAALPFFPNSFPPPRKNPKPLRRVIFSSQLKMKEVEKKIYIKKKKEEKKKPPLSRPETE